MTQIRIVCDSPKHPKRIVKIETFTLAFPGEEGGWNSGYDGALESTTLIGDRAIPRDNYQEYRETVRAHSSDAFRMRYTLECKLCGPRSRVAIRDEKIDPLLDAIASQGVSELSLSLLSKLVSRQG